VPSDARLSLHCKNFILTFGVSLLVSYELSALWLLVAIVAVAIVSGLQLRLLVEAPGGLLAMIKSFTNKNHVHYDFPKDLCVVCLFFFDEQSFFVVPIGQVDS
jgi:hypothetical protein